MTEVGTPAGTDRGADGSMQGWRRGLFVLNLALVVALVAGSAWAWPLLPERIPRHFNVQGMPDAWGAKSATWFLLPAIGVFTYAVLEWSAWLVRRRPQYINMPSKKQFLQLPAEEQAPIAGEIGLFVQGMGTLVMLLFCVIQYATYGAALGQPVQQMMQLVLVLTLVLTPLFTVALLWRSSTRVNAAVRRSKLRGTMR